MWGKWLRARAGVCGVRILRHPWAGQGGCPPAPPLLCTHSHPAGQHPDLQPEQITASACTQIPVPPWPGPWQTSSSRPVCFISASSWVNRTAEV